MKHFVLSGYPLSRAYRESLVEKLGTSFEEIQLLQLRALGANGMLKALRSAVGDSLYVAYDEPSSTAILPVLEIAAAFTQTRSRYIVDDQLRIAPLGRFDALVRLAALGGATFNSVMRSATSMVRSARLLTKERTRLRPEGTRVLYLNSNLWFGTKAGGSVGHISGVANALAREGNTVLFCTAGGRMMVDPTIDMLTLEPPRSFGLPWVTNSFVFDDLIVRQLHEVVRRFEPSFIYQRMSLGNTSGVRLSRRHRVPLVLEYNGSEVWVARHWGRRLAFEKAAARAEEACLRHAHLIVTVSDVLEDELVSRGVDRSRIATYPNCIDPAIFDPQRFSPSDIRALRARHGLEEDAVVVTFLGSFGQWHGVPILAQAIRQLIDRERTWLDQKHVRFLLVGDGVTMHEVRAILGPDAEGPYVRLTGLVPQEVAPLYLAASDIVSSPHVPNTDGSRFFGSPTKLYEYMAMGKAIVASDLDQIGEVLRDSLQAANLPPEDEPYGSHLSILCTPGRADSHRQAIRFLVDHPLWRARLGANAREVALRRYTWSTHVRHILDQVQKL